jgi:pilus assembly protein CpaF
MSFFASKHSAERVATPMTVQNAPLGPEADRFYRELVDQRPALIDEKLKLHARIIDEFNLPLLEKLPHEEFVRQISAYVSNYVRAENLSLNQKELNIFSEEIIAEMIGYGPIEPLLKDPTVTDILINTHEVCFVERFGRLYETKVHFKD